MAIYYRGEDVSDIINNLDTSKLSYNKKRLVSDLLIKENINDKEAVNEIINKFNPKDDTSISESVSRIPSKILSILPSIKDETAEKIGKAGEKGVEKFLMPVRETYINKESKFGKTFNKIGDWWEKNIGENVGNIVANTAESIVSNPLGGNVIPPIKKSNEVANPSMPPLVKNIIKEFAKGTANLPVNFSPADLALGTASVTRGLQDDIAKGASEFISGAKKGTFLPEEASNVLDKSKLESIYRSKGKRKLIDEYIPYETPEGEKYLISKKEAKILENISKDNRITPKDQEEKYISYKSEDGNEYIIPKDEKPIDTSLENKASENIIISKKPKNNAEKKVIDNTNDKINEAIIETSKESDEIGKNFVNNLKDNLSKIEDKVFGSEAYSAFHRAFINKDYVHGFEDVSNLLEHSSSKANGIFSSLYHDFVNKLNLKDEKDLELLTEYYHKLFKLEMYKDFNKKGESLLANNIDQYNSEILKDIENNFSKEDVILNLENSIRDIEKKVLKEKDGIERLERLKNNTNNLHDFNKHVFTRVAQSFGMGDEVFNKIIEKFSHYIPPEAFRDYFGDSINLGGIFNKTYADSFMKSRNTIYNMPKNEDIISLIAKDAFMKLHAAQKKEAIDTIMHLAEERGFGKILPENRTKIAEYLSQNPDQQRIMIKGKNYAIHKNIANLLNTAIDIDDKTINKMLSSLNMISRDQVLLFNPNYALYKTYILDLASYPFFSESKPKILDMLFKKWNKGIDKISPEIKKVFSNSNTSSLEKAIPKALEKLKFKTNEELGVLPTEENIKNYFKGYANSIRMSISGIKNKGFIDRTAQKILGDKIDQRYIDRMSEGRLDTVYFPKPENLIEELNKKENNPLKLMFGAIKNTYDNLKHTINTYTIGAHDDAMKYMAGESLLNAKGGGLSSTRIKMLNSIDEAISMNKKELDRVSSLKANKNGFIEYFSDINNKKVRVKKEEIIKSLKKDAEEFELKRKNILFGKYGDLETQMIDNVIDARNAIQGKTLSLNINRSGKMIQQLKVINMFVNPMIREISKIRELTIKDRNYFLLKCLTLYGIFKYLEKSRIEGSGRSLYLDERRNSSYIIIDTGLDVIENDVPKAITIAIGSLNPVVSFLNALAINDAKNESKEKRFNIHKSIPKITGESLMITANTFYDSFSMYSPLVSILEASRGQGSNGPILMDRNREELENQYQYNRNTGNLYRGIAGLSTKIFGGSPMSPATMEYITKGVTPAIDKAASVLDDYIPTFGVPKKDKISEKSVLSKMPFTKNIKKLDPYDYYFKEEKSKIKSDEAAIIDFARIAFSPMQSIEKREEAIKNFKEKINEASKENPESLFYIKEKINKILDENKNIISTKDISKKAILSHNIEENRKMINYIIDQKIDLLKRKLEHGR